MNKKEHKNAWDKSEVENKIVTVDSNQGYRALMVVILVLLLVSGVYYFYFSSSSDSDEQDVEMIREEETKKNFHELKQLKLEQFPDDMVVNERIITDLPSLPPLSTPQVIPEVKVKQTKKEENIKETLILSEPILPKQNFFHNNVNSNLPTSFPKIGGRGYPKDRRGAQMLTISKGSKEDNVADNILYKAFSVQPSVATTQAGKLRFLITQGKIIDAVLETSISSDLQGTLRAVVSSNVYAEGDDTVLIPRGSRLIGRHSFDLNIGKTFININWDRIILPNGISISISSPGTDKLGRTGISSIVDNKIASSLFSSILLGGISIGSAVIGQKASSLIDKLNPTQKWRFITATEIDISPLKEILNKKGEEEDEKNNNKWKLGLGAIRRIKSSSDEQNLVDIFKEVVKDLGLVSIDNNKLDEITLEDIKQLLPRQENKSFYEETISKSISDFSKDIQDIVNRSVNKKPTVYVDQGTALKVFVNQDIVFSPQLITINSLK